MRPGAGALAAGFALCLGIVDTGARQSPTTAWIHGAWFDGTAFRHRDVYTVGDRMTFARPETVDRTVNLQGQYVTSAFAEAHNHNIPSADTDRTLREYLRKGIEYVMIQGNVPEAPASLVTRINTPTTPDVAFANGLFTAPGGHPTALVKRNIQNGGMTPADLDGGFLQLVSTIADVERVFTTRIATQRPDFIKIVLVYSADRVLGLQPPADSDRFGLDPALVPEIVRLAHASHLRVSAHVEDRTDFDIAVKAGVDLIAHLPGFWPDLRRIELKGLDELYRIDDASAAQAGRRHVSVVTTIGETLSALSTPDLASQRQPILNLYRHNLAVLASHGVTIAIGSDQFRGDAVEEALAIDRAGVMAPAALLRALSSDGARTIFPSRGPFGLVEGALADFLVFDANPLADFSAITRIRLRVKSGRELDNP